MIKQVLGLQQDNKVELCLKNVAIVLHGLTKFFDKSWIKMFQRQIIYSILPSFNSVVLLWWWWWSCCCSCNNIAEPVEGHHASSCHSARRLWNLLPPDIRNTNSLFIFKSRLNTHLFKMAYSGLNGLNLVTTAHGPVTI